MSAALVLPVGYDEDVATRRASTSEADPSANNILLKDALSRNVAMEREGFPEDSNQRSSIRDSLSADAKDMRRMGKPQQFIRHFRLFSIISFVAISTAAWEICIFFCTPALTNGGRANLVYSMISSIIGFGPIYLSMAEMSSMAPTAGAQYHWVSEFAPESCQRSLSYITGWTSTLSWQTGNALGVLLIGSVIETIMIINNEGHVPYRWQVSLLALGSIVVAYIGAVYWARVLPYWQNAVFAIHIFVFFAYIIPPWISAPQATHSQVWLEFQNSGGWSSLLLSIMVGQFTGIGSQVGVDAVVHMSEEVKDASYSVPRAMIGVYMINSVLLLGLVITISYHIPSVEEALAEVTTYPGVYVLRQSMSNLWVTIILTSLAFLITASNIVYLTTVSRDLFAFARDHGLPFSGWISRVHPRRHVPENACILSSIVSILLALVFLGSPPTFYAITSLFTVAVLQNYWLSIGCILWRRISQPETLPYGKFSLGRYGVAVNLTALLYCFYAIFWSLWPQNYPVTVVGFNWASVIFSIVLIISGIYFVLWARYRYVGPVAVVDGRKIRVG